MRAVTLGLLIAAPLFARVNFVRQVKPILETRCVRCHGPDVALKNLRLNRRARAMLVIVPRKPDESRLYLAVKSGFMPPGGAKLTPAELEILRKWIAEGAHWPKNVELSPILPK